MTIAEKNCLQRYFEFTIINRELDEADKKRMFELLASVYMLNAEAAEKLFAKCERGAIADIANEEQFKQYKRLIQFFNECGQDSPMSQDDRELLDIKGQAIYALNEAGVINGNRDVADYERVANLMRAADNGKIRAMFLVAAMKTEGIVVQKDEEYGRKLLTDLSRWSNADGLLLCLHYDCENREELGAKLRGVTDGLPEAELYEAAKKAYDLTFAANKDAQILKEAIAKAGKASVNTFRLQAARIAFSEILTASDKQRFLSSTDADMQKTISSLPLQLPKKATPLWFAELKTPLSRQAEQKKVHKIISSDAVLSASKVCFFRNDHFVLEAYMRAIKEAAEGNVQIVKLSDVSPKCLEFSFANVFLRSTNENMPNLFLVEIDSACSSENIALLTDMIDDAKRAHFSISSGAVELDLSALEFVLFCHESQKSRLTKRVFGISLADVDKTEGRELLAHMIEEEETKWQMRFDPDVVEKLDGMDLASAQRIISYAAQNAYFEDRQIVTGGEIEDGCASIVGGTVSFGFGRG